MSTDHTRLDAKRSFQRFVAIGGKHGKDAAVGTEQLRKRVLVQPTLDVPAEVIDHARQRDLEMRDDISGPGALLDDTAQRNHRLVALEVRQRAHRQDPVEGDEHEECGGDGHRVAAAPRENRDDETADHGDHRCRTRAVDADRAVAAEQIQHGGTEERHHDTGHGQRARDPLTSRAPSARATQSAPSAATAVTIGKMYRSCFVCDNEKNTTMIATQRSRSVRIRTDAVGPSRRSAHQVMTTAGDTTTRKRVAEQDRQVEEWPWPARRSFP